MEIAQKKFIRKLFNGIRLYFSESIKDPRTRHEVDEMFQQLSDLLDTFE